MNGSTLVQSSRASDAAEGARSTLSPDSRGQNRGGGKGNYQKGGRSNWNKGGNNNQGPVIQLTGVSARPSAEQGLS